MSLNKESKNKIIFKRNTNKTQTNLWLSKLFYVVAMNA